MEDPQGWQELLADIRDCFVTGKWTEAEDAETLLQLDDQDDGMFCRTRRRVVRIIVRIA